MQQAAIRGVFEDKFTKADMLLGTTDQDYEGSKEVEEDVTDLTEVKLDYAARSLILNLRTEAENITRVELTPRIPSHRVPADQLEIYIRNGIGFTKLDRTRWTGVKDSEGKITIRFTPLLQATEIKIHCNYDDLDILQLPVDRAEFYNAPGQLATVYQKLITRTEYYQYDAMGNRTVERILLRKEYGWSYEYYPNSNRLKAKVKNDGTERIDYEYDPNGNLTVKVVTKEDKVDRWEYSYDLLNHLEQVKKNGEVVSSYIYDSNGFRVEKKGSRGRVHYVPLLNGKLGYKKEFTGNTEYSFIYGNGDLLARVNGIVDGLGKKFFYHNDHLGSNMAISDVDGNKVIERDFAPFGQKIDLKENQTLNSEEKDIIFAGQEWDEDIGLYYCNARWYDPEIGIFISEDLIRDANNLNLYTYCHNNRVPRKGTHS